MSFIYTCRGCGNAKNRDSDVKRPRREAQDVLEMLGLFLREKLGLRWSVEVFPVAARKLIDSISQAFKTPVAFDQGAARIWNDDAVRASPGRPVCHLRWKQTRSWDFGASGRLSMNRTGKGRQQRTSLIMLLAWLYPSSRLIRQT